MLHAIGHAKEVTLVIDSPHGPLSEIAAEPGDVLVCNRSLGGLIKRS